MEKLAVDEEFRRLIPPLTDAEYRDLEASITEEGCRDTLVVWNGTIIDGHNRYGICQKYSIEFAVVEKHFDSREEAKIWIIQNQLGRRNLTAYDRSVLVLRLEPLVAERGKEKQRAGGIDKVSQKSEKAIDRYKELGKIAGVSHDTLAKVKKIIDLGDDRLKENVGRGEISINQAYKTIRGQERREEKMEKMRQASEESITPLNRLGKFSVLLADPPWRYEHPTPDRREIENVYPTMALWEIKEMDISSIALEPSMLFLWTPNPKMEEAVEVIKAWGFNYRTNFAWTKDRIGQGYYNRQKHELLLVAVKGNMIVPSPENRYDSVIDSPREEHSKKPDCVYEMIERMYPGLRKVELFARRKREGWASWGNELQEE